jgi:hypothetical protein
MLLRVVSIGTVIAWLHLFVLALCGAVTLLGHDRLGLTINFLVALSCLAVIGIASYAAFRPKRPLVLVALLSSSLVACLFIADLYSHVSIGHWWHVGIWHSLSDRIALAWLYGIVWFLPLPFLWAMVLFRLSHEQAKT